MRTDNSAVVSPELVDNIGLGFTRALRLEKLMFRNRQLLLPPSAFNLTQRRTRLLSRQKRNAHLCSACSISDRPSYHRRIHILHTTESSAIGKALDQLTSGNSLTWSKYLILESV
ncbi:hypothetical protein PGT21_017346 [Puccinia graminis f. sp. tritici]|uniref:Uncharacterized protein n=1 Tax=Puccinia graminis f. sp. tritici TaxID=56615 RepID=A0A5B0RG27_PUCGR|nr:hypothetical protein PGT21_017346 [Puccinia graminis f. sp. tritici]KAA1124677.1 hypothetical protein PGTUg99_028363 [Puccinia graminis f. sp. tritici]